MWPPVAWMTTTGMVAWLGSLVGFGSAAHPEALLGLAGPLVSANVSWLLMARAQAAGPERLMAILVRAMAAKMVMFGLYVAVVVMAFDVRPVPFAVSFTGSFIGLYVMEAVFLKRLIESNAPKPAG